MKTAVYIRTLSESNIRVQKFWHVIDSQDRKNVTYIVTSSVSDDIGSETLAFRSDIDGVITDWQELNAARFPADSHAEVLESMGMRVVDR